MIVARAAFAALFLYAGCAPAGAHTEIPGLTGFTGGFLHPLVVPAQAVSLLALALMLGQQRDGHRAPLVAGFAIVLLAAIGAIALAYQTEQANTALLVGGLLSGLIVAVARPVPLAVSAPLVVLTGAAIEFDSVSESVSMRETSLALFGTAFAAWLAVVCVMGATATFRHEWQKIGVRIVGSWSAATALLVLALQLKR